MKAFLIVFPLFLVFWTYLFAGAFLTMVCFNPNGKPSHKLFFCNAAMHVNASRSDRPWVRSSMLFERGIAHSQLDRIDDARRDFTDAIIDATSAFSSAERPDGERHWSSPSFVRLTDRIEKAVGIDPATLALWEETVASLRE